MNKIRVAVVYHYYAHYRLPVCKELMNSKGIEYTLISDKVSNIGIKTISPELALLDPNLDGLRWLFVKNHWLYKERFLWQSGLLSILKEKNFDAVIFLGNVYYLSTWIAILYLKWRGKKVYLWTHGVTSSRKDMKWKIRSSFYSLSHGLLLYGNKAKEIMIKNGFPKNKLHVIYNSLDHKKQKKFRSKIDDKKISRMRQDLFNNPELPLIIFVGRLTPQKKLKMLIEASLSLRKKEIHINILFVGAGSEKERLEDLVEDYGLSSHIHFYGPCYNEQELSLLIGAADICVSPGEVGLTAITSLGYGTPVISHNDFDNQMPEYEAIIRGFNGNLFEYGSISDLVERISNWIDISKSVSREEIRNRCFKIVDERYNPNYQTKVIEAVILNNQTNESPS